MAAQSAAILTILTIALPSGGLLSPFGVRLRDPARRKKSRLPRRNPYSDPIARDLRPDSSPRLSDPGPRPAAGTGKVYASPHLPSARGHYFRAGVRRASAAAAGAPIGSGAEGSDPRLDQPVQPSSPTRHGAPRCA